MGPSTAPAVPFWKCLAAGGPTLALGLQFLVAALGAGGAYFTQHSLGPLIQVEFLVLHGTLFLGCFGLVEAQTRDARVGQRVVIGGLLLLYTVAAFQMGWRVGLEFFLLMAGTNLGLVLTRQTPSAITQMILRWSVAFLLFVVFSQMGDMPKAIERWADAPEALYFGAGYFIVLGLLDISGFFFRAAPGVYQAFMRENRHNNANYTAQMNDLLAGIGRWVPARRGSD
jgi:hypothetical protein